MHFCDDNLKRILTECTSYDETRHEYYQGSYRSWKVLELYTSGYGIVSSGLSSREADK